MKDKTYDVGSRITHFRKQKNYTVNRLANLAGISQSYLRDVELGNKNITVETLSLVCNALDLSLYDFFNDIPSKWDAADPLIQKIYSLDLKQREALLAFLNALAT